MQRNSLNSGSKKLATIDTAQLQPIAQLESSIESIEESSLSFTSDESLNPKNYTKKRIPFSPQTNFVKSRGSNLRGANNSTREDTRFSNANTRQLSKKPKTSRKQIIKNKVQLKKLTDMLDNIESMKLPNVAKASHLYNSSKMHWLSDNLRSHK